jgi:hypothetical protein
MLEQQQLQIDVISQELANVEKAHVHTCIRAHVEEGQRWYL